MHLSLRTRLFLLGIFWLTLTPIMASLITAETDDRPYTAYLNDLNATERAIDAAAKSAFDTQTTRGIAPARQAGNLITSNIKIQDNWTTGYIITRAPENVHGGPDLRLFIGQFKDGEWEIATEYTPQFYRWLDRLPAPMLAQGARETLHAANPETVATRSGPGDARARLSWPWPVGVTWYYMSGPHGNGGNSYRPWSSLDLGVGGEHMNIVTSGEGWIYRADNCPNFVRVDHAEGWQTGYYHVIEEAVVDGQWVDRGTYIGKTSNATGCGGWSTNQHTHLSLRRSGSFLNIAGTDIGGWTVLEGDYAYDGYARRVRDSWLIARTNPLYNDGSIGSGYYDTRYDLNVDGNQDLWAVNMRDSLTDSVSVNVASGNAFIGTLASTGTGMPQQPEWLNTSFASADYDGDDIPDLWVIHRWDGAEKTAFRIMSGANLDYLIADELTALPMYDNSVSFAAADYNRDGTPDLWAILPRDGSSNGVRVQIVNGENPQQMIANADTIAAKPSVYSDINFAAADWDGDGVPDLWMIEPRNEVKNSFGVKILSGADWETVLIDTDTPLPQQSTDITRNGFVAADYDNDTYTDLWVIDRKTGQVTIIDGENFDKLLFDVPTVIPATNTNDWQILGSDRAREAIAPDKPPLIRPFDGIELNDTGYKFRFDPAGLGSRYKFLLKNAAKETVLKVKFDDVTEFCLNNCRIETSDYGVLLQDDETYTWKVNAYNPFGKNKSEKWTFTTDIPGPATLAAPFDELSFVSIPTFTWTGNERTDTYKLVVKNIDKTFKEKVIISPEECSEDFVCEYTPTELYREDTYKWKVVSKETTVKGKSKSEVRRFSIVPPEALTATMDDTSGDTPTTDELAPPSFRH